VNWEKFMHNKTADEFYQMVREHLVEEGRATSSKFMGDAERLIINGTFSGDDMKKFMEDNDITIVE
jgi:hypothetical protein